MGKTITNKERTVNNTSETFMSYAWYRQDYDIPMTEFIRSLWGQNRRARFLKEVNEYRERVIERERERLIPILAKKFKQSDKSIKKLIGEGK